MNIAIYGAGEFGEYIAQEMVLYMMNLGKM